MNVVECRDLSFGYGNSEAVLDGVDLMIEPGQVVGLLGRNGAGKTTLIRIMMGMLAPERGSVRIFGTPPRDDVVALRRRIGYVSESQDLPGFLSVRDVLSLHRSLYPTWDEDLARSLGERFVLPPERKIGKLSKGQARQVALLCAISHRPELLILDEPAGGLDPAARREFLETSISFLSDTGSTILFSSHHMTDVERMAGRLVMIHDGLLWIDSDVDAVREGYSLALVPDLGPDTGARLLALDGCLCVRPVEGSWRAVFECAPEICGDRLRGRLDGADVRCVPVGLEEMFIELVGGRS